MENHATLKFKVRLSIKRGGSIGVPSLVQLSRTVEMKTLLTIPSTGLWVWRGKDLVFSLSDNWQVDYESYDWHLLDPKSDQTKALVEAFLLHEEEKQEYRPFDGLKHAKYAGHKLYSASILK